MPNRCNNLARCHFCLCWYKAHSIQLLLLPLLLPPLLLLRWGLAEWLVATMDNKAYKLLPGSCLNPESA
jgi:hypothetical protein